MSPVWADAMWEFKCPGCGEVVDEGDPIGLVEKEWCCASCCEEFDGRLID